MKTLKTMSILGLVMAGICYMFVAVFMDNDPKAAIGWGVIAILYLIAYSIVGLVQANRNIIK